MVDMVRTVQETALSLSEMLRRTPTVAEIAEASGLAADRVLLALETPDDTVSLDRPVGDDTDADLGDFVEDTAAEDPFQLAVHASRQRHLDRALAMLDEREQEVVRLRFGLDGDNPRTLSDVGGRYGFTRERVRQIEGRAIAKLRHPSCDFDLESLL